MQLVDKRFNSGLHLNNESVRLIKTKASTPLQNTAQKEKRMYSLFTRVRAADAINGKKDFRK